MAKSTLRLPRMNTRVFLKVDPERGFYSPRSKAGLSAVERVNQIIGRRKS